MVWLTYLQIPPNNEVPSEKKYGDNGRKQSNCGGKVKIVDVRSLEQQKLDPVSKFNR